MASCCREGEWSGANESGVGGHAPFRGKAPGRLPFPKALQRELVATNSAKLPLCSPLGFEFRAILAQEITQAGRTMFE